MVARPSASFAAESALVLEHVMAKLVGEDVAEHETPQRISWPSYDTVLAEVGTGIPQLHSLVLREGVRKPPRRRGLIVETYLARPNELAEHESAPFGRRGHQLHRLEPVVRLRAEGREGFADVGSRGGMMSSRAGPTYPDHGKGRPSCGANGTRIASAAVGHAEMMTTSRESGPRRSAFKHAGRGSLSAPHGSWMAASGAKASDASRSIA